MKKMALAKLAASTLILGVTMVGCGMTSQAQRPGSISDSQAFSKAVAAAKQATKALAKRKFAKAVTFAEQAVELQPRDAGYRMLLGQVYLATGRFQSAEQSFVDTLSLDPNRERAALNLALAQAAIGKRDAARSTLTDYRDKLPAADYGLAVALAGDPDEAVRVLEFATRAPDANAKTRQNLALSYALAGKWNHAKVMAIQDLTPDAADARLAQWASFVKPVAAYDQVAAVLGVKPQADGGQPTRLALATPVAPVEQVAAVTAPEPMPEPVAESAPVAVAEVAPQPAFETETAVAPVVTTPATPVIRAETAPIRSAVVPASRAFAPRSGFRNAVAMRPASGGRYVVQLGAFSTSGAAERAWTRVSGRFGLASYDPINGAGKARNATLVRLSIAGFGARGDADRVCTRIRQGGGVCFVRTQSGDAPARWVQRKTFKVAAR